VAEIVPLKELLRFVHSHGRGGAAVESVAARESALITDAQPHEPVGPADTSAHPGEFRAGLVDSAFWVTGS
jgi:hypothetical protein